MADTIRDCVLADTVVTIHGEVSPDENGTMPPEVDTTYFDNAEDTPYWCKHCDQEWDTWDEVVAHLTANVQKGIWTDETQS